MPFSVNVLGTGSSGNAILIDDAIMLDMGLGWRTIKDGLLKASAIFVSHQHGDHLNKSALNGLLKNRPAIISRGLYLNEGTKERAKKLMPDRVKELDTVKTITTDNWSTIVKTKEGRRYHVTTFELVHDVENQGFVITNDEGETLIHATDTMTMKHAPRRQYDYLLVEGNWDEDKFMDMIEFGSTSERLRASYNVRHLSVQAFEKFVRNNSHDKSVVLQLHESMDLGSKSLMGMDFDAVDLKNHLKEPI